MVPVLIAQTATEPKPEHDLLVAHVSWQSRALFNEREEIAAIDLLYSSVFHCICVKALGTDQTYVLNSSQC